MKTHRIWQGVRMRSLETSADPDSPPRTVTIPAAWDDGAAAALAQLVPGEGAIALQDAAERWIRPIAESANRAGLCLPIAERLHTMLLRRRGAPLDAQWRGEMSGAPGFVLNLAGFYHPSLGFDIAAFAEAAETATIALALAEPAARELRLGMSDLAGLLAALGLPYGSPEARGVAACLAALLRGRADHASATLPTLGRTFRREWPMPPAICAVPGLAEAARQACALESEPRHRATTAILPPGAADALLGVETGGIAPSFSPIGDHGGLNRTAQTWLAARGVTAERALAALLAGEQPFPEANAAARTAMWEAVSPHLHHVEAPPLYAAPATHPRRALPARHGGYTQKVAINGHKLYLRTGEYDDGQLGEIAITVPKEGSSARGLMDALCGAVSLGLQHGVGLDEFVDLFTNTRFGAAGLVEGDPNVAQASSVLDYAFRHLAANYLGRADIPPLPLEDSEPAPRESAPLLPLDLPRDKRRLRVVGE